MEKVLYSAALLVAGLILYFSFSAFEPLDVKEQISEPAKQEKLHVPKGSPIELSSARRKKEMIFIPEGEAILGCDPAQGGTCSDRSRKIWIKAIWIDRFEARESKYSQCVKQGFCTDLPRHFSSPDFPNSPARAFSWYEAEIFCRWQGKRLPTEDEWEKAARGPSGGHRYPWGDHWVADRANWCDGSNCDGSIDGYAGPAPVDAYPENVSPYGVRNMAGNIGEWVNASWQEPDRIVYAWKGGSHSPPNSNGDPNQGLVTWYRGGDPPDFRMDPVGVRCAADN